LYVSGVDEIHALDAATGVEKWRVPIEQHLIAPLASAGDLLVAVFEKGVVRAFAAHDGQASWTQEVGAPSRTTPVSDGVRVFLALEDGRVIALKLVDGTKEWEKAIEGTLNQPSVARDRLFVGTNDNFLYAFDSQSGRLAWKWKAGGDVIGISADRKSAAFYASLDNVLRSVNRGNGNQRWIKEIPTRPAAPPQNFSGGIAYKEIVVLTGATSEIDAFAADTGAAAGTYMPPADIIASPLIDPALKPYEVAMVVITRDGRALGLRPSAMALPEPMNVPFATELPGRRLERERLSPPRPATP
jgi:outer membrane protein assembly factor BamB